MVNAFSCLVKRKVTDEHPVRSEEIEKLGREIKREIDARFGRSLAIRELDAGSDNAAEIEINNLSNATMLNASESRSLPPLGTLTFYWSPGQSPTTWRLR